MSENILTEERLNRIPFSLEAEQAILAAIIVEPEKIRDVANVLVPEDFYLENHQKIYEAMRDLFLSNNTIDIITLNEELVKNGTYDKTGGLTYISSLAQSAPSIINLPDYLRIVKDKAVLRKLIEVSEEINRMAYSAEGGADAILDRSEQLVFDIAEKNVTKGFVHIKDAIMQNYQHLQDLQKYGEAALGTPTNFTDLDKHIVGMGNSDLIIVGARPAMGKTSFVMNIATEVASKTGKTVAVFNLEMSSQQVVSRMLASTAYIDSQKMRRGDLSVDEWVKLGEAAGVLSKTNILIDDTSNITVAGMKAKLRRVKNLGLVIIDYLQLMESDRYKDNRVQGVSEISRALKLMAKDLNVPVIACSQLSRANESRTDKKPMLSDIRESGAIEQDADIVLFLHRQGYYEKDKPELQNVAQVIVAKNRHGTVGEVNLGWIGQYTKFTNLDKTHE